MRTDLYTYRKNRAYVLGESDICYLCGRAGATSVDHVIPWSKGGDHSIENLRPAHLECNKKKYNKTIEQLANQGEIAPKTSIEW